MSVLRGIARAVLAAASILIVVLAFIWPAIGPDDAVHPVYRVAAIAALWIFLGALATVLWDKACRAPRT